jgi:hypothetical protein
MKAKDLDAILRAKHMKLPKAVREWYLLSANWNEGFMNVWVRPDELTVGEGTVYFLGDVGGVWNHCVRVADFDVEDPPVICSEKGRDEIECPRFSIFVAMMAVNDVICDYRNGAPVKLNARSARAELTPLFGSGSDEFLADAPLESAKIVSYDYLGNGPVIARSRTSEGRSRLQTLRRRRRPTA